jgi:DNA-binding transcriptional regulator LsrR (DeoR family)
MSDEEKEVTRIDAKIDLMLTWMRARKGKLRNGATTNELGDKFNARRSEVERVMLVAHQRGLVHIYPREIENYY